MGVTLTRKNVGAGPLAELAKDNFKTVLANAFRRILLVPTAE
jgi:DNA-directed RNA polymerase alpha subunit